VTPTRIHHLNFIVRNLDEATARFEQVLGVEPFETIDHAQRGVHVARTRIGESWLILVCPYDHDSPPGKYLAAHGEGFFLASFGVRDLDEHLDMLRADEPARAGILDWRVADLGELHGALLQLTQDDE
jgi:methylmalonyl-CoA/ethylmalonyl-CoA epimerase